MLLLALAIFLFFAGIGFFTYGTYLTIKPYFKGIKDKPLAENGKKLALCAVLGVICLYWSGVVFKMV